jgi:hypothetical protein
MKFPFLLLLLYPVCLFSQQVADTSYNPPILHPAYEANTGPVVFIDEGHFNFHTKDGRYRSFAHLLERDGYQVQAYKGLFKKKQLAKGKILVISNALNAQNEENWYKPVLSAFSPKEIKRVEKWVRTGGSLFLIADHMPLAGAAKDLAAAFGFEFTDGFVMDTVQNRPIAFNRADQSLRGNPITNGRFPDEKVEEVVTFTGQGFKLPEDAIPILVLGDGYVNLLPDTAWVFTPETIRLPVTGWSQGAYKKHGKGKVVAFGEAAMFSAQLAGPQKMKMGMNNPVAPENYQLLLNIIHWLDGKLE